MRFLDSSAIVKLVLDEAESAAIERVLNGERFAASALVRTEVVRAVLRRAPARVKLARDVIDQARLIRIDPHVLDLAATIDPPTLRSLDAIHLASALELREELEAFVAYDDRLLAAASALGMPVASPGA